MSENKKPAELIAFDKMGLLLFTALAGLLADDIAERGYKVVKNRFKKSSR